MDNTWQVQEAKARFSEMLETSLVNGPQIVTNGESRRRYWFPSISGAAFKG